MISPVTPIFKRLSAGESQARRPYRVGGALGFRPIRKPGSARRRRGLLLLGCLALWPAPALGGPMPKQLAPAAREHFAEKAAIRGADRFILLHDTGADSARVASKLLKRTHRAFYDAMTEAGFELAQPRRPLICLLFEDKQAFVQYGKAADRRDMSWSGGYYSTRTNHVALYQQGARRIPGAEERTRRTKTEGEMRQPDALGSDPSPVSVSLSRATHETAHQLAFNSGLQKRGILYPFWVSEGVATTFELTDEQRLGPGRHNKPRRRALVQAREDGRLLPLAAFVGKNRIETGDPEHVRRRYAQAWGLFQFLLEEHRDELVEYMARLRNASPGWRSEAALKADFVAAFGPIEELEAAWRHWVDQL